MGFYVHYQEKLPTARQRIVDKEMRIPKNI